MSTPLHFVILAAGKGTRMKSELPKVLHPVGGEPMIVRILRTAGRFQPVTNTVVVGHRAEKVRATLAPFAGVGTVIQEPQLGTGHALQQAEPALRGKTGTVVLLYGDVPMLSEDSIARLLAHHQATAAAATVLTAHLPHPAGLGRIVRENGRFRRIVEERDASEAEKAITEFNSGIYAFALDGLFDALSRIGTANDQGEYYLTDLLGDLPRRRTPRRDVHHRRRRRAARRQQPRRAGGDERPGTRPAQRGDHGRRRHARRSGLGVDRPGRRDRPRHDDPPERLPRRQDHDRQQRARSTPACG